MAFALNARMPRPNVTATQRAQTPQPMGWPKVAGQQRPTGQPFNPGVIDIRPGLPGGPPAGPGGIPAGPGGVPFGPGHPLWDGPPGIPQGMGGGRPMGGLMPMPSGGVQPGKSYRLGGIDGASFGGGFGASPSPYGQQYGGGGNPYGNSDFTVGTSIQPQGVYTPQATQTAMNQAIAGGQQTAYGTPQASMMGFAQNSPALASRNTYNAAQAIGASRGDAEAIRLGDRSANLQNILAGQTARATDVLGQLGNLGNYYNMNQGYGNQMLDMQQAYGNQMQNYGLGTAQNLLGGGGGGSFQNFLNALNWQ